jgi:DNA-directed RNA polymerase subunit alpha
MTNFDKLEIDVVTDGSVTPREAVSSAGKTLAELLGLFADFGEGIGLELGDVVVADSSSPDLELPIEALDLSERPRNCLRGPRSRRWASSCERTAEDLLNITNFGQKSLEEVSPSSTSSACHSPRRRDEELGLMPRPKRVRGSAAAPHSRVAS